MWFVVVCLCFLIVDRVVVGFVSVLFVCMVGLFGVSFLCVRFAVLFVCLFDFCCFCMFVFCCVCVLLLLLFVVFVVVVVCVSCCCFCLFD